MERNDDGLVTIFKDQNGRALMKPQSGIFVHEITSENGQLYLNTKVKLEQRQSKAGNTYLRGTLGYKKNKDGTTKFTNVTIFKNTGKGKEYFDVLTSSSIVEPKEVPVVDKAIEVVNTTFNTDEISF